ncbi:MAG: FtsH protease activity modulator HflK [Burkholderiaceae bacterium]
MTPRPLLMSSNEPGWGRSGADSGPQGEGQTGGQGGASGQGTSPAGGQAGGVGPRAPGPVSSGPGGSGSNGSGPGGPSRNQRPPEGPPDLDELWRDLSRKLNGLFGGRGGRGGGAGGNGPSRGGGVSGRGLATGVGVVGVVALLLWLASGFFIVPEGQEAAVLRFGQFRYLTPRPGIQWRMPWPIEREELVDRSRLRQVEVGYRSNNVKNKVAKESLILTGDRGIVDVQFAIQYRIADVKAFLFENSLYPSPDELLRQAAESAIREVVGRRTIDQVLYSEKAAAAEEAQRLTQLLLDRYKLGIGITDLTIQQAQPPEQVQGAFEDANKAEQDRQRMISEGQAYANDVVPRARGTADRLRLEAQGYRARIIATAEGDASRFGQVLDEYSRAPQVTRERMYLETMQQIFSHTSKVLVDSNSGSNLLYLPIDKLIQQAGSGPRSDPARSGVDTATGTTPPPSDPATTRSSNLRSRDRDR